MELTHCPICKRQYPKTIKVGNVEMQDPYQARCHCQVISVGAAFSKIKGRKHPHNGWRGYTGRRRSDTAN